MIENRTFNTVGKAYVMAHGSWEKVGQMGVAGGEQSDRWGLESWLGARL